MEPLKKKLDGYMAVFNCHLNNANERAAKEFVDKYGLSIWTREIQPIIDSGVMSIFQQEPNEWTQFYVDTVTRIVNEDREPESETISSEENMSKVQDSVLSMQDGLSRTTIPHDCTVVNVFPGDLRDWFAGMALAGLMSNGITYKILAPEVAYQIADAMIKARATSTGENG